ncbi:MAG: glycosyltransferase family 4 protein [Acidobacteriaceae bacterium]|jgi:glycosyltransferase involved in cell wall biosynthesis|nr:glycosyltransferase family 4 protein [Acidobacteriaceae bacterium]
MRFGIDAHAIGRHLTGNEVYVRNLLEQYDGLDRDNQFFAYVSVPGADEFVPRRFEKRWVSNNPFRRLGFDLSRGVRRDQPDVLHVQYTAPLLCSAPVVVSVHDVSYLEHPEFFPRARRIQLRWTVERTVRRAAKVVTLSEFSRAGIARAYGMNPDKIAVVPAACSEIFRPQPRAQAQAFVDGRFSLRAPFILCVGDLQPRKNPIGLIRAFEELVANYPQLTHKLVFVGKDTWFAPRVHQIAEASPFSNRIHFTGYVNDDELLQLYNAGDLFVFPSFYEGFGIPLLEAMACGVPVACSNRSAMREVAGEAAHQFNPYSTREMVVAMRDLLLDPDYRAEMGRRGRENAARYSWRQTARQTLDLYHGVVEQAKRRAPVSQHA